MFKESTMNTKEFLTIQTVERMLPLLSRMPGEGLGKLFSLGGKIAPH